MLVQTNGKETDMASAYYFLCPRYDGLLNSIASTANRNKLGFWRKNITYLLHTAVAYDTMLLKQEINVYMKMCKKNNETGNVSMPACDVRSHRENPEVIQNLYMFM